MTKIERQTRSLERMAARKSNASRRLTVIRSSNRFYIYERGRGYAGFVGTKMTFNAAREYLDLQDKG